MKNEIEVDEAIPNDFSALDLLNQQQIFATLSHKAIDTIAEAISDCKSEEDLSIVIEVVSVKFLMELGHHGFPDNQLSKDFIRIVSTSFKDKVEDLVSEAKQQKCGEEPIVQRNYHASILKYVIDTVFDSIYANMKTNKALFISPQAVRIFYKLINSMVGTYALQLKVNSFTHTAELVSVFLLTFLADVPQSANFGQECRGLIFHFLYSTLGIKIPNYKSMQNDDIPRGRFMFLGLCLQNDGLDSSVKADIAEDLLRNIEKLVLNDKEPLVQTQKNLMYFGEFLSNLKKDDVEGKLLPQIEFIMNRSSNFVGLIAKLIRLLKQYVIEDLPTLKKWTSDLISEEAMTSLDSRKMEDLESFFAGVHSLCSQEMRQALISEILWEKFKQSKRGNVKTLQRHRFLHIISCVTPSVSKDVLSALLDHSFSLKEESDVSDIGPLIRRFVLTPDVKDIYEIIIPLLQKQQKIQSPQHHVQLIIDLLQKHGLNEFQNFEKSVSDLLLANLTQENFRSTLNAQNILVYSGYFALKAIQKNEIESLQVLINNEQVANYLFSPTGYCNTLPFLESKELTFSASRNQLYVIEGLIRYHFDVAPLKPVQFACLLNTLGEYLLNQRMTFRERPVLTCFEHLQYLQDAFTVPLFKMMFEKISEVGSRPTPKLAENEFAKEQSLMTGKKVQLVVKMLYSAQKGSKHNRQRVLDKQEFFLLLRTMCHPHISGKSKDLMYIMQTLTDIMDKLAELNSDNREFTLASYFDKYSQEIIQYALVQRTGILSPNLTLREIGKNMLVCLGWQGYLVQYIDKLMLLLNSRPLELAVKMKDLIKKEASSIGIYDMMFYSEMSKDLMNLFSEKDQEIAQNEIKSSLAASNSTIGESQEGKEEEKTEDPFKGMTPSQIQAALMKKAAANKAKKGGPPAKGATSTKPGVKSSTQAQTTKPSASAKKEGEEEQVVDKETRKKMDIAQLLNYCNQIQEVKGQHVQTVFEILRNVNQIKEANILNYQDLTLKYAIMPAIKLLNYNATRFQTFYFLQNLFTDNRHTPFYGIRVPLMKCLQNVQENRIYQKTVYDFQKFFDHVRQAADFGDMDVGYLQMILLLANFILRNPDVNLSVKESALNVAQDILETNPRVKNMDLVRLTINMMKSNYIGKNLSGYLSKLIKRLSVEELAVMLQKLFEFDPIARQKFLNEVLAQSDPLFCPVWFSTQMWILQFDDEFYSVSRKIWNKFGLVLRTGVLELDQENDLNNIYFHLRSRHTAVFDMAVKAGVAAIEILQNQFDGIIEDLLRFYHTEVVIVKQLNLDALRSTGDDNNFEGNKRFNRIALPLIIEKTACFVPHSSVQKLLDFFITIGSVDSDVAVSKKCLEAADAIIHARASDYAGKMLQILERFVEEADKFKEESVHQAIVLIGTLSDYLDKNSQKKLIQTFEKMLLLLMRSEKKGASELVNKSICKCIPKLSRFFEERTKQIFNDQFNILRTGKVETELRGAAYACAGIIKGQGLKFFKERDIINIVNKECFQGKKIDVLRTLAGLQLYETLSYSQGKAFEPYVNEVLPNIMNCISDAKEQVRSCANAANMQIVMNFSNHAIKQVVPLILVQLQEDNWRVKYAAVEALGNMALCAPKQILGYLPDIVKALRQVLNDTHEKVHAAAIKAIANIGSVIKCPEVAELLDVIIKALGNSNDYLNSCLDALLETSFVHAIDAPSLSLLVPLIDIGLTRHEKASKQKASQLVGNICSLTQDPQDLLPYMKILIPAIKSSLFDSIPETRASAAKALGKLSKGLGLSNSLELLEWLKTNLGRTDQAPSERSGAAQGLSEVMSAHGDNFFSNQIKEVITQARSKEVHLRESYRNVMAYLPTSFANFANYLVVMLPIMIEGLADDSEEVRKVSMRNVKICIQMFGKKASEMLCKPILAMMFDKDSRVRMSSSILMYQLVKEMENDIIKSQPKYINIQMKYQILSAMFILRFDPIEKVSTQASQIWKSLVDAPVHILRMIIETLIQMVFENIQSKYEEQQEMGLACMRGLVEKFGERIVNESLDIFESYLEQATDSHQTSGISRVILNMAGAAGHRLLQAIKPRLLAIADPFLIVQDDTIRQLSAQVFTTIFKRLGDPVYTQSILEVSFMQKLNVLMQEKGEENKNNIDRLIKSLTFMLEEAPELKIEDKLMVLCGIPSHTLRKPLSVSHAVILRAIAPRVAPLVFQKKFYNGLYTALKTELSNDPLEEVDRDKGRIQALLMCFAETVACVPDHEYATINEEIMEFHDICCKRQEYGLYVDLIAYYCQKTASNYERHATYYTQNVLKHMNSPDKELVDKVVNCISAIFEKLSKENQFALVPVIRDAIEEIAVSPGEEHIDQHIYQKKVAQIGMFETKEGVKILAGVFQNSIMHGSIKIRVDSAYCFKYLIDFASPAAIKNEVIKICGALIRVVNDKFSPDLKIQMFLALRLLLVKAAAMVRAMVAQLQTTFLKAFGDSQSTAEVRRVVVQNLILLLQMIPKADPIVKDLAAQLESDKVDGEQKIEVAQALSYIIREKGKTIQESISKQVYQTLTAIIEDRRRDYNDKVLVHCAVALGYLSAYSSKPAEMNDLFKAYDHEGVAGKSDYRICLGIKLGIIMNGSDKVPNAAILHQETKNYVNQLLRTESGIVEIDGKDISENRPDEEIFRFDGAFDAFGYILDTHLRRFYQPDSPVSSLFFNALTESQILSKLNEEEDFSGMSKVYAQVPNFISVLTIPSFASKPQKKITDALAQVMRDSFTFLQKFYLEFDSKRDARPALLNLLQLTYNNSFDLSVSTERNEICQLTHTYIRDVICELPSLQGIIPHDMKMVCSDIILS